MGPEKISNKKVLLLSNVPVLGEAVIHHGLSLSDRMGGVLEVLHLVTADESLPAAQSFHQAAGKLGVENSVAYTQLLDETDLQKAVLASAKERRNLLCVILYPTNADEEALKRKQQRKFKEITQLLSCPVVLYTDSMRCNVKVLIGITQNLDSVKNNLFGKYKGLGSTTEVGPFKTREEAEKWKQFMMNRRDNYEEIDQQASGTQGSLWYGFTVESPKVH